MKTFLLACGLVLVAASGASAQGFYIGPNGIGVDSGRRDWDRDRWEGRGGGRVVREWEDDDGCTIRIIRREMPDGDVTTRRVRRCD
jgi:hypothetical protein